MSQLIDGQAIAARITEQTASAAAALSERGITPVLTIVMPGDDPGARRYVSALQRLAAVVGVDCRVHREAGSRSAGDVLTTLDELSADPAVHAIICQAPLPPDLPLAAAGARIAVAKDVDGANPASLGGLAAGVPGVFAPATAAAVIEILTRERIPLTAGRHRAPRRHREPRPGRRASAGAAIRVAGRRTGRAAPAAARPGCADRRGPARRAGPARGGADRPARHRPWPGLGPSA